MVYGYGGLQLLPGPLGSRVRSHAKVKDPPGSDLHDHKYVEESEVRGDRDEEVTRNGDIRVIAHEGRPALQVTSSCVARWCGYVLPDGAWGYAQSELESQLVCNAFLPPGRVLPGHLDDQVSNVGRQARSAATRPPSPEQSESLSVPAGAGSALQRRPRPLPPAPHKC